MEFPTNAMVGLAFRGKVKTVAFWVTVGFFIGWAVPTLVDFFRHVKYVP